MSKTLEAMHRVSKALASTGISKALHNKHGGYDYRGIDQVFQILSPILVEAGLQIWVADIKADLSTAEVGSKKTPMQAAQLVVSYMAQSIDGNDGPVPITAIGHAFNSGDKAVNAAMSAAYKNMVFQTFCAPFAGHNLDQEETYVEDGDVEVIGAKQITEIHEWLMENNKSEASLLVWASSQVKRDLQGLEEIPQSFWDASLKQMIPYVPGADNEDS